MPQQTGILLINLGTPGAPTAKAVWLYLREFLSDKRIVELPRWLWIPILYGVILPYRAGKSAKKYQKIWTSRGSPLLYHTQDQSRALWENLRTQQLHHIQVAYAMRYGAPDVLSVIKNLLAQGCQRLIVLPLYPQYAASSTASALDMVYSCLRKVRNMPALSVIKDFHDHPGYIHAMAQQIRSQWQQYGQGEHLVMSFHGVPVVTIEKGDPYFVQCQETARLLANALDLKDNQYTLAFQSRFGRGQWLKPATNEVLKHLAQAGIQHVDICCPGFVADCLETLEEIAIEGKAQFETYGGKIYHYLPCLNANKDWINVLTDLCQQQLAM